MATLQSGKCFTVPTFFGMCCRSEWQERMYIYKWHEVDQTKHEIFCVHIVCDEIQVKVNLEITTFFFYLRFPYCPNFFWFGVVSNTPRTGRSRKTSAVDDRNIVTAVKKDPKTTVSDISNNLQRAGVKVSQSTVRRRLHEQKYRGYTRRCKPLISKKNRRQASKILGQGFMDWFYGPKWWKG